jgi:hypothetical protein
MPRKEELIARIVYFEWTMLQEISGAGGRASCQDDFGTFEIMRHSQAASWSEDTLESWAKDLAEAGKENRNLVEEKYARMMRYTHPGEYALIEGRLRPLDSATEQLVGDIVRIVLPWEEALARKYPAVARRGRPIHSSEDTESLTSVESYTRGELETYSKTTLELYLKDLLDLQAANRNGSEIVLAAIMRRYGFGSPEEAEARFREETPVTPSDGGLACDRAKPKGDVAAREEGAFVPSFKCCGDGGGTSCFDARDRGR